MDYFANLYAKIKASFSESFKYSRPFDQPLVVYTRYVFDPLNSWSGQQVYIQPITGCFVDANNGSPNEQSIHKLA